MVVLPNNPGLERRMAYSNYVRRARFRNSNNFQIRSIQNYTLPNFWMDYIQSSNSSNNGLSLKQLRKNSNVYIKENIQCCICYQDDNKVTRKLKCGHEFHLDCIELWLTEKNSCPICRKVFN